VTVLLGGIAPHPPLVIPEVGGGEIAGVKNTVQALKEFSKRIAASGADTWVFISPHGLLFRDAISINAEEQLEGDFAGFGVPQVRLKAQNDKELVEAIASASEKNGLRTVLLERRGFSQRDITLDHGVTVPLYYLQEAGVVKRCVSVTYGLLSYNDLFRFGRFISSAAASIGRNVAVIASGDLSHRLIKDAPAGYNPRGKEFDEKLVNYLREYRVEDIMNMDDDLVMDAGECGLRSIIVLLGSLSDMTINPEVLSYEGPFGVGYLVALFTPGKEGHQGGSK